MSRKDLTEKVKENVSYDILKADYNAIDGLVDEITELIVDVVSGQRKVRLSGKAVPEETAVRKFLSLSYEHVAYVLDNISVLENKISKPDVYICTALYNALFTLNISSASGFTAGTGMSLSSSAYSLGRKSNGNAKPSYDLAEIPAED